MTKPTEPTGDEWEGAGATSSAAVWALALRQIAYLRSRPAERPEFAEAAIRDIRRAIFRLRDNGWTEMAGGLDRAFALVLDPPAPPEPKRTWKSCADTMVVMAAETIQYRLIYLADALDALTARLEKMDGKP